MADPLTGGSTVNSCKTSRPGASSLPMRWFLPVVMIGWAAAADVKAPEEPKQPVSDSKLISRSILKPWVVEDLVEYSGSYTALKGDGAGTSRMVLTSFVTIGGDEMISMLRLTTPDLMAEPVYTVLGSVACDPKTGEVKSTSAKCRMITYTDPNTNRAVFGVEVDGVVYADWSHTPNSPPVKALQPPDAPPGSATPIAETTTHPPEPEKKAPAKSPSKP